MQQAVADSAYPQFATAVDVKIGGNEYGTRQHGIKRLGDRQEAYLAGVEVDGLERLVEAGHEDGIVAVRKYAGNEAETVENLERSKGCIAFGEIGDVGRRASQPDGAAGVLGNLHWRPHLGMALDNADAGVVVEGAFEHFVVGHYQPDIAFAVGKYEMHLQVLAGNLVGELLRVYLADGAAGHVVDEEAVAAG